MLEIKGKHIFSYFFLKKQTSKSVHIQKRVADMEGIYMRKRLLGMYILGF